MDIEIVKAIPWNESPVGLRGLSAKVGSQQHTNSGCDFGVWEDDKRPIMKLRNHKILSYIISAWVTDSRSVKSGSSSSSTIL